MECLPNEIITMICEELFLHDKNSFLQLRLVNCFFYMMSHHHFQQAIETLRFTLRGLDDLEAFAGAAMGMYAHKVRRLIFKTPEDSPHTFQRNTSYHAYFTKRIFANAFEHFPKLEAIEVQPWWNDRDLKECKRSMVFWNDALCFSEVHLKELKIECGNFEALNSLHSDNTYMPLWRERERNFRADVLPQLKRLELSSCGSKLSEAAPKYIAHFLHHVLNVEALVCTGLTMARNSLHCHSLRHLELQDCTVDGADICHMLLNNAGTLQTVKLIDVLLHSMTWMSVFKALTQLTSSTMPRDKLELAGMQYSNDRHRELGVAPTIVSVLLLQDGPLFSGLAIDREAWAAFKQALTNRNLSSPPAFRRAVIKTQSGELQSIS